MILHELNTGMKEALVVIFRRVHECTRWVLIRIGGMKMLFYLVVSTTANLADFREERRFEMSERRASFCSASLWATTLL